MQLSVIIPCYNAASTIAAQLEALAGQSWPGTWEVIVADNRSTDDSMAIVNAYRGRLPNLRIVDASVRQGQPYALNAGASAATGEALAFCDADDEVGMGWVAGMGEALSRHDFVACRIDTERLNPSWLQESRGNAQCDGLQRIWYPPYLPHAGGGTLGVKRALHEAVGGFDESLPYLHDTDYCFKIQLRGVPLHFVQDAVVHIRYRERLGSIFHQARLWAVYNVIVYKRYQRASGMKVSQPWRKYLKGWKRVVRNLPQLRRKGGRAAWLWRVGWQIGRLEGSIKHRVHPI